ncbi:MAG: TrmH family methyltransferase [Thermoleophilia bacterium]|nr:TrmH family methyltransferase [Thermoleophilia bacterium]
MLIAVAHNLHSLQNVGAIFRTADGAGFDHVILSGHTGQLPDPRISKVALGAEEFLTSEHVADIDALLQRLEGAYVVLVEQTPTSVPPTELPPMPHDGRDIALVVCDELSGAAEQLAARADVCLELPMRGQKHSLNVAVAFAIASYAVADSIRPFGVEELRARVAPPVRDGVLTRGRTVGENAEAEARRATDAQA